MLLFFERIILGNRLSDWGISLLIIVGAFLLNKGISLLNKNVIQKITAKSKNRLDDLLVKTLEAPILLGIALIAVWVAARRLDLGTQVDQGFYRAYQILTVLNITWFLVKLTGALINEYLLPHSKEEEDNKRLDESMVRILRRISVGIIWAIGIVMALNNAGVNVGALLASLGIGGLAVALAAQDTLKNFLGGLTIFMDRPFRIGDRIVTGAYDGFVEDVGIRSTRIRNFDRRIISIPNYKIVDAAIENISIEPMRRVVLKIGLTYNTPPEKMKEAITILKNIPQKVDEVFPDEIYAYFTDFSDSALTITFIYFIKKEANVMETPSKVNMNILEDFNAAGLNFAFPTRTVYIENQN
ncbi:MAG TPA: mechanosensitive ion channel family protein [Paludibacteraceae bacterium]|nr:mechanosensitive ion channel family protein [Paludibacteraceae bacterium]OPZ02094.1 MAG: Low conductance mechanosensitive channel YnaI [Bacteroidetes bacterium ADurb.BinA395]HOF98814.1 mechanosensitive ion channel family protein [Paludibacteraceae bacterium]HOL29961.1 mechanosensitive ion channel family protein [Paludibacteraceae bacterium]HOR39747.1 mechanosensitive ion channel family protein [Paludibacteraceae bacterium]